MVAVAPPRLAWWPDLLYLPGCHLSDLLQCELDHFSGQSLPLVPEAAP